MKYTKINFDKLGLFVIGIFLGFSAGVAVNRWHWFPEKIWWHNPLAIIPQSMLSYVSLLAPVGVFLIFLISRRKYFKTKI